MSTIPRSCGGCTACCKTHGIIELQKPPGIWCHHCMIGHGCAIYNQRPGTCQGYRCGWLDGLGNDEHRPDKMKVVPDISNHPPLGKTVILFELEEGSVRSEMVARWSLNLIQTGICVVHRRLDGDHKLYSPKRLPVLNTERFFNFSEPVTQVPYARALIELASFRLLRPPTV